MKWLEEVLKAAGVEKVDELVKSIQAELPKYFKPAEEFNARGVEIDNLKKVIEQRDEDLKKLQKNAGKDTELSEQLKSLQTKYDEDMKTLNDENNKLRLSTAIKLAVASEAHDVDLVAGLVDTSKLVLGSDGKVSGLDEQIKLVKEGKPFLFKTQEAPQQNQEAPTYGNPFGGGTVAPGEGQGFNFNFTKVK